MVASRSRGNGAMRVRELRVMTVVLVGVLAAIVWAPPAAATHWVPYTSVSLSPPVVKASSMVDFTVNVTNSYTASLHVCSWSIQFSWDASPQVPSPQVVNIASRGWEDWSFRESVPALTPSLQVVTVTINADSSGDLLGCETHAYTVSLEVVTHFPPVAAFTYGPVNVTTSTVVQFTDHSYDANGSLMRWSWDFGDGANANIPSPSHIYHAAGTYRVTLSVTDDQGATNSTTDNVLVIAPGGSDAGQLGFVGASIAVVGILGVGVLFVFLYRKRQR